MGTKLRLSGRLVAAFGLVSTHLISANAKAELKVVSTLPIYSDIAARIGGERIKAESLLPKKRGIGMYEPTADDITKIRTSDLVLHSGVGAESWLPRLVEKSGKSELLGTSEKILGLASGFRVLQTREQLLLEGKQAPFTNGNPYFALSPKLGLIVASRIAERFKKLDPEGVATFDSNLGAMKEELEPKIAEWTARSAGSRGKKLVGYGYEGVYLADFLGLSLKDAVIEDVTAIPSTSQIQNLIMFMGLHKVPVLVRTEQSSKEISEGIAKAVSAKIVTICENVGDLPECPSYTSLLAYNVEALIKSTL